MGNFIFGIVIGVIVTVGFWLINRLYWKSMYELERNYSDQLKNLFEQNYPFKIRKS